MEAIQAPAYTRIELAETFSDDSSILNLEIRLSPLIDARYHLPQEEIALGPACWLVGHILPSQVEVFH